MADSPAAPANASPKPPGFREAFLFWLKLGFISFGGPAGQIAIMHQELVEKRRWISEARFLHALNFCHLLPGPEAQQLATYIGWLLHRTRGGIVAGTLFVLPSAVLLWLLSWAYVTLGHLTLVEAFFAGLKPAVLAIVASAVLRIGRKALKHRALWAVAGLSFLAIFVIEAPFPLIIGCAAAAGWFAGRLWPSVFKTKAGKAGAADAVLHDGAEERVRPTLARALKVTSICLLLWWGPILATGALLGRDHVLTRQGVFFSQAAMVTFGGAYAVLPYVAEQAVEKHGWLDQGQMLDGLAFAETTPGPLIMVLQFVGFMGAWRHPEPFSPLVAATLGSVMTTWATFLPCFLWIFLGAPWVERLRENPRLTAVLTTITAAVVGVVLHLAVWFGQHLIFPEGGPVRWVDLGLAALAFTGMQRWKWGMIPVIFAGGLIGVAQTLF